MTALSLTTARSPYIPANILVYSNNLAVLERAGGEMKSDNLCFLLFLYHAFLLARTWRQPLLYLLPFLGLLEFRQ